LYGFYGAYKHGYRIITGHANGSIDIITYIDKDGSQMYFGVKKEELNEIRVISKQCSYILDCIFENHHERIKRETTPGISRVNLKTVMRKATQYEEQSLSLIYPTRGETKREEESIGDEVYKEIFNESLERENKGKIVAIDIDNKILVSMNFDAKLVIEEVHNRDSSGRIRIRRVGNDAGVGIKIW